jgi:4-hydroxy-tetrahydrodipicolinate synthase
MVTVPAYVKPTQNGIVKHFNKICNQEQLKDTPIIMYNVPGRASVNMEPKTMKQVCETCPNVVAVKEASGSIDQLIEIKRLVPNLQVFAGDDKLVLDFMIHGACGLISVASNVFPNLVSDIVKLCLINEFVLARDMFYQSKFPQFVNALFSESNPIPVKYAMYWIDVYSTFNMIGPMTELSVEKRDQVKEAINEINSYSELPELESIPENHEYNEKKEHDVLPKLNM